jgi:addiction module HigA family antidote
MAKQKIAAPADALKGFMDEYQVSVATLAADIQLSGSAVRQLLYGKMRVSLPVAGRLAKYFGTTIQYWTDMQGAVDFAEFKDNEKLLKEINGIAKAKKPKTPPPAKAAPKAASTRAGKPPKAKADAEAAPRTSRKAKAADAGVKTPARKPRAAKAADKETTKAPKAPKALKEPKPPKAPKEPKAPKAPKAAKEPKAPKTGVRGRKAAVKPIPQEEVKPAKPKTILIKKSVPNPAASQEPSRWPDEETPPVSQNDTSTAEFPEFSEPDFSEN